MGMVIVDISMSLDGFVAGPGQSGEEPLGRGGEALHEWAVPLASFRQAHGQEGGERGPDDDLLAESFAREGAVVMGRRMFSGGSGPWEEDPRARGWWGDEPPFHCPVFVLTSHPREPLPMEGGTTFHFVTEGIERALDLARDAADGGDVGIGGGGSTVAQFLDGGLVDELHVHIAPVLLGSGARMFGEQARALQRLRAVESPSGVVHVAYRVE